MVATILPWWCSAVKQFSSVSCFCVGPLSVLMARDKCVGFFVFWRVFAGLRGRWSREPWGAAGPHLRRVLFGTASCSGHLLDVDYLLIRDYSSHRLQPFARRWTKTPASAMAWITSFLTKFFLVFVKIRWRGSWFWCRASSQRPTCWSLEILSSLARRRDLRLQLALQGILVYWLFGYWVCCLLGRECKLVWAVWAVFREFYPRRTWSFHLFLGVGMARGGGGPRGFPVPGWGHEVGSCCVSECHAECSTADIEACWFLFLYSWGERIYGFCCFRQQGNRYCWRYIICSTRVGYRLLRSKGQLFVSC